jgi:NAD(P)-dependent dehydrogenase (short-subunit alcohol dehydrogenase family)
MSQVWLITGSSRGLGRAFAEAVLASGFQVAATARNTEDLAEVEG